MGDEFGLATLYIFIIFCDINQSFIIFYQQADGLGVRQPGLGAIALSSQSFQLQRRQLGDVQRYAYWTGSIHDLRSQASLTWWTLKIFQFYVVF